MKNTTNVFLEGLVSDMHPLTTSLKCMTDALNATLLTFNGNEQMLQNDMGNTLIQDSATGNIMGLNPGFIPLGLKEHGGIMYIASINKDGVGELGTIPSPIIRDIYKDKVTLPISSPIPIIVSNDGDVLLISNKIYPSDKILVNLRMGTTVSNFIGEKVWLNTPMSSNPNGDPTYDPTDLILVRTTGHLKSLPVITSTSTSLLRNDIPVTEIYNTYSPCISFSDDTLSADVIIGLGFPDTTSFDLSSTGINTLQRLGIYKMNMFVKNSNGTIKVTNPELYELQTFNLGQKSNHWFLHSSFPASVFPKDLLSATLCGDLKLFPSNYKPGYLAIALVPEDIDSFDMLKRNVDPKDVPFTYKHKEATTPPVYYTYFPGFYYLTTSGIYIDKLQARVIDEGTLDNVPLIPLNVDGTKGAEILEYTINFKSHTGSSLLLKAGSTELAAVFYTTDPIFSNDLWLYAGDSVLGYPLIQTRNLAKNNTFILTNLVNVDDTLTLFESSDYISPKDRSGLFCAALGETYNKWLRLEVDYYDLYDNKKGTYTKRFNPYINDVFGTNLGISKIRYADPIVLGKDTPVEEKQVGYFQTPTIDLYFKTTIGSWFNTLSQSRSKVIGDYKDAMNTGSTTMSFLRDSKASLFYTEYPDQADYYKLKDTSKADLSISNLKKDIEDSLKIYTDGKYWYGSITSDAIKIKVEQTQFKLKESKLSGPGLSWSDDDDLKPVMIYLHGTDEKDARVDKTDGVAEHAITKLKCGGQEYTLTPSLKLNQLTASSSSSFQCDPGFLGQIKIPSIFTNGENTTVKGISDSYNPKYKLSTTSFSVTPVFGGETHLVAYANYLNNPICSIDVIYETDIKEPKVTITSDSIKSAYKVVPYLELVGNTESNEEVQISRFKTQTDDLVFECNFERSGSSYVNYFVESDFEELTPRADTLKSSVQIDGVPTKLNDINTVFNLSPGIYVLNVSRSPLNSIWDKSGTDSTYELYITLNGTEYTCRNCPEYKTTNPTGILRSNTKLYPLFKVSPENTGTTTPYSNYWLYEPFVIIVPSSTSIAIKVTNMHTGHKFTRLDIGLYKLKGITKVDITNFVGDVSISLLVMRHLYYMSILHEYAKSTYLDAGKGILYYDFMQKFGVYFAEIYSFTDGIIVNEGGDQVVRQLDINGGKYGCTPYIPSEPYFTNRSMSVNSSGGIEYHLNIYVLPEKAVSDPGYQWADIVFSNDFPNPEKIAYRLNGGPIRLKN